MKKLATKLTPAIKQWIKETHGSDYYEKESKQNIFHYPSLFNKGIYVEGHHLGAYVSVRYTEVTESEFLAEFGNPKPKRGDVVLVRDEDSKDWLERIFLCEIEGAKFSFITVHHVDEESFKKGNEFIASGFKQMKPIETISKEEAEKILKKRII